MKKEFIGLIILFIPFVLSFIFKKINYKKIVNMTDKVLDEKLGNETSREVQNEVATVLENFAKAFRGDLIDNHTIGMVAEKHLELLENSSRAKQVLAEFADELLITDYYGDINLVSKETIRKLLQKYVEKYGEVKSGV